RAGLLLGGAQRVYYPGVHAASRRALSANRLEVVTAGAPDCCGALELHSGEEEPAVARARSTIAAFEALGELDHVITGAAGCGSAMKEYGELLGTPEPHAFAGRVRGLSEAPGSAPAAA